MNNNESNSIKNHGISNSKASSFPTSNLGKIMIETYTEKTTSNPSWFTRLGFASSLSLALIGIPTIAEAAVGTSILPAITWFTPGIPNKASIALTATNFFNKYVNQKTVLAGDNFAMTNTRQLPYRSFGLNFTFKFGHMEFKGEKEAEDQNLTNPQGN